MAGQPVKYLASKNAFRVGNDPNLVPILSGSKAFAPLDILGPASVLSLARAMREFNARMGFGADVPPEMTGTQFRVTWTTEDRWIVDNEGRSARPTELALMHDGSVFVTVYGGIGSHSVVHGKWVLGESLLSAWLAPLGGTLMDARTIEIPGHRYWSAGFAIPFRGHTVADIERLGTEAISLIASIDSTEMTLSVLTALLRSGRVSTLVGRPESQLLEAKRQLILTNDRAKFELAKDVSALANSNIGGVLVVGLETKKKRTGDDEITRIVPVTDPNLARTVRGVINRMVYPPIEGLAVELVPTKPDEDAEDRILMILVPPQVGELRPFLVSGAMIGAKLNGTLIGLYERRGDDVQARSAASIHAALSAGLALLRGPWRDESRS